VKAVEQKFEKLTELADAIDNPKAWSLGKMICEDCEGGR